MIAELVLAGCVSFAAAFVLHVGAFSIFALITSLVYLALVFGSGSFLGSLGEAAVLFAVMQCAYVLGVLIASPFLGKRRQRFPALQRRFGRTDSTRDESR